MDQMKTGMLIRMLRQRRQMTQLQLAERIGVSDKAVSKWERGRGAPDISLLPALSEALVMKKLYPEWGLEVRLPHFAHGTLLWYCTRHGLFAQEV